MLTTGKQVTLKLRDASRTRRASTTEGAYLNVSD